MVLASSRRSRVSSNKVTFFTWEPIQFLSYWGWRTKDQIMQLYNQNLHLVDNLLRAKGSQGLVRDHPDLPGDESMRLYYVTLLGFIMVMPMLPIVPRHPSSLLFDVRFSWICPTATRLKSQILCSIASPWKLILLLRPGFFIYFPLYTQGMSNFSPGFLYYL